MIWNIQKNSFVREWARNRALKRGFVWDVVMVTAPRVRNFLGLRIIHQLVVSNVMNIQNFVQFSLELWSHNMEFSCSLIDFVDEGELV